MIHIAAALLILSATCAALAAASLLSGPADPIFALGSGAALATSSALMAAVIRRRL